MTMTQPSRRRSWIKGGADTHGTSMVERLKDIEGWFLKMKFIWRIWNFLIWRIIPHYKYAKPGRHINAPVALLWILLCMMAYILLPVCTSTIFKSTDATRKTYTGTSMIWHIHGYTCMVCWNHTDSRFNQVPFHIWINV